MYSQQMVGLDLLHHSLARFLPIIQKAETALTAPNILQRLATSRTRSTSLQPPFRLLLPRLQGRNEICDHIMRCRDNRRAELHYSQLDDLGEHLDKTNTPRSLATAIIQGITGWYRNPNYQIPLPRHNPIRPNAVLRQALTDQNANRLGSHVLRPNLPGFPNSA
jgi:hypothetical protein